MLNYKLKTKYAEKLDPSSILPEYPRPQFKRNSYFSLNGTWQYEINKSGVINGLFEKNILVPFPFESDLSGVQKTLKKGEWIIYKKTFSLPDNFIINKTLLHFGAVDQICKVMLNGDTIGEHKGGYLPFSFDISNSVKEKDNILYVLVLDNNSYELPTGKQRKNRGGIFYTSISGIWQTVWLESLPFDSIDNIRITPDIDNSSVGIKIISSASNKTITISYEGEILSTIQTVDNDIVIPLSKVELWSPETPRLYNVEISTKNDTIWSYFAMRKISIQDGKFLLNNKPYFMNGVLDQGYFSDGIYTPASYNAYKDDILSMKALGFNTLRKHIKIEPMMFYYYCDVLGMIVMQDMVNVGKVNMLRHGLLPTVFNIRKLKANGLNTKQRKNFINHVKETLDYFYNVPSILYYTIFNEGWGEFQADELYDLVTSIDHSRIIDATSGWYHGTRSDVDSHHIYFKPIRLCSSNRPQVVSEFGGFCHKEEEHSFHLGKTNGTFYKMYESLEAYEKRFIEVYEKEIIPAKEKGLWGAIYTQLSDVEDECNGIYTYDRKICKLKAETIRPLMERVNKV